MARWAFDDAEPFRLELGHRVNNPASCGVARAAGFAVETRQRQKLEYDGVRFDVELHARLTDAGRYDAGKGNTIGVITAYCKGMQKCLNRVNQ